MVQKAYRVLLIDDDEDDFFLVRSHLRDIPNSRYIVEWANSFHAGQVAMVEGSFDAVLVDYRMGASTGIELIREAVAQNYPAPIILLTGQGNYDVDLEAMQTGAADYLNKVEINSSLLDRSIRYAIERKQHETALRNSEQALRESEGRFRVALSNVAIAVFSTDLELRYTWVYSTAVRGLPEQFLGKRDDEIFGLGNGDTFFHLKQRVLDERISIRDEIVMTMDGQPMRFVVSIEPYFDSSGALVGVIGALYDVTEQRRLEQERIEHLTEMEVQHRLTRFREQERQAIAREIHDGPVQFLSSLIFRLQYSQANFQDPAVQAELEDLRTGLKETVENLREMMNELRPPSIIRFGIARGILSHLQGFQEKHPELEVVPDIEEVDDRVRLPDQVKLNLYRIYHEAMSNIIHHAKATKITIRLAFAGDQLSMSVEDNGKGLSDPFDLIVYTEKDHYGLAGMQERARLIGGELLFHSEPGQGTVIRVIVPVAEEFRSS